MCLTAAQLVRVRASDVCFDWMDFYFLWSNTSMSVSCPPWRGRLSTPGLACGGVRSLACGSVGVAVVWDGSLGSWWWLACVERLKKKSLVNRVLSRMNIRTSLARVGDNVVLCNNIYLVLSAFKAFN